MGTRRYPISYSQDIRTFKISIYSYTCIYYYIISMCSNIQSVFIIHKAYPVASAVINIL